MIQLRARTALLLPVVLLVGAACEASGGDGAGQARRNSAERDRPPRAVVANCEAAIVGNADSRWRERSTTVGNLGFYGIGRDFRDSAVRPDKSGDLFTKLPVIIKGSAGASVWVPREERGRVALRFGDARPEFPADNHRVEGGATRVRFEPCADKKRTGWPGGLVLKDRKEIALRVRMDGASRPVTVTLGRLTTMEG